jgi:peptide deformylase
MLSMSRWPGRVKWRFRSPRYPLLSWNDPRLREAAVPLPEGEMARAGSTIQYLEDTLHWFQVRHGAAHGIAAPQIGVPERIIIVERDGGEWPMVNPVILWESGESRQVWERCMSFPRLAVCVRRPVSLSVRFVTWEGLQEIWEDVDPDLASLVRHEVDHLDGILTLDRAEGPEGVIPWDTLRDHHRPGH